MEKIPLTFFLSYHGSAGNGGMRGGVVTHGRILKL